MMWPGGGLCGRGAAAVLVSMSALFGERPMRAAILLVASALAASVLWPLPGAAQNVVGIADPAESAAYGAAMGVSDPTIRAPLLDAFARRYPSSIARLDALELAMADYQRLNDPADAERTARAILQSSPDDVRALGVLVFIERRQGAVLAGAQRAPLANAAAADAGHGLKALPAWAGPEGAQPEQTAFAKSKLEAIFYSALGFERLVKGDTDVAKYYYLKAVTADPSDVQTDFELAIVDLTTKPIDQQGFWWGAKAYVLAREAGAAQTLGQIDQLAKASYVSFHGGDDGWEDLLALAETETAPPADFTIKAAPSPAELAVQAVQDNDPASLTVTDWEFVLAQRDASPANHEAADKVWAAIVAVQDGGASKLKLPVKVLSASRGSIEAAITDDNQRAGRADLHVVLAEPMSSPPAPGSSIKVVGLISAYAPQPFAFTMQDAQVAAP
jgi:hypothetical protein